MADTTKAKAQLVEEIEQLQQRVAELEKTSSEQLSLEQYIRQTIIDTSPAFFVVIDSRGETKMVNKSMLEATGYSDEEVQGKDYLSTFIPERERASLSKLFEREILRGKSTVNQNHVLTKDGRELFCEWQGRPLPGPKGKVELFCGVGLNITGRHQTEEAYRILVESSLQALVIIQNERIVFVNHAAEVATGYTAKELMDMTSPIQTLVHPQDLPERLERTAQFARGEDVPPLTTYRIVDRKGEVHWVETYTTRIEWKGKSATHTTFIDITERKQADEKLAESEQHYRLLIENIPSVAWVTTREGKTVFISDNVEKVYGYTPDEIKSGGSELWFDRIHPEDRRKVQKTFELLFSKEKEYKIEYRIQRKDSEWIWLLDSANIVEDVGGRSLAYGVFSDITDRKEAEEALRESEDRFRRLSEATFEGVAITEKGIIIDANERLAEMVGYTLEELIGMEVINLVALESRDFVRERIISGLETPYEHLALRKDKSVITVEVWAKNISYKGRTARVTSIRDITEHKQAEEELQRISQNEIKRREELEKLREVSTNMRQANGSSELLQVFTREVQRLCKADAASSILFKASQEPVTFFAPKEKNKLSRNQSDAIRSALLNARAGTLTASIPSFESVLILQLQSADAVHGAVLVVSREQKAFTQDQQNLLNAAADMAGTALNRIDILETLEERVQQRTRNLVVLYNLITIISENWRLQDLLELSLVLTLETVKADRGIIYLSDGKEIPGIKPVIQRGFADGFQIEVRNLPGDTLAQEVFKKQKPLSLDNLKEDPAFANFKGLASYAGIPIIARGNTRGVFSLFSNSKEAFGTEEMALLASIADHLGIGIENSILYEQSRESAALEERNRLARDLHDSVSQLLYSLTLMAGTTKKMLERGSNIDAIKNSVERLGDTAHRALKEMRLLLFELRPAVLESEGLIGALQHRIKTVEEGLGMSVDFQAEGLPELPNYVEDALYHITMEAFNNIVKHSESTVASLKFTVKDDILVMEISDKGKGFDTDLLQRGLGLRNMRERGQMLDSEVIIYSKPGEGTRVTVETKLPSGSPLSSR